MTAQQLADKFAEYISKTDWVSHGELLNRHADLPLRGDCSLILEGANVALFVGCSELFCDAIAILREEKPSRVVIAPCHSLVLFIDGCPMPAKMKWMKGRPPKGGYKQTRFAPVCFRPAANAAECGE